MDFASERCVPCDGGVPSMAPDEVSAGLRALEGWTARTEPPQLHRRYRFRDFAGAMRFVNALAAVAEAENHHPDFTVHSWNQVDVTLWTHSIGGLHRNDFIVAAKLDRLPESRG